jgi:hypothetical protein
MLIVPLIATPSQTLTIVLGGQACKINVYQKEPGIFVDLFVNDVVVIGGVVAQNKNRIVRYKYLGFSGDLMFADSQGNADPYYEGLGDRYQMSYFSDEEIAELLALT